MHCIIAGPVSYDNRKGKFKFKEEIEEILTETTILKLYLSKVSLEKHKCVTKEALLEIYKNKITNFSKNQSELLKEQNYGKCIGDTLEDFMTLGQFSK